MEAILQSLIYFPMFMIGYFLDDLVVLLRTPEGFVASCLFIMFIESLMAKNISKDQNRISIRKIISKIDSVVAILHNKTSNIFHIKKTP